jgi:hypothetical protein
MSELVSTQTIESSDDAEIFDPLANLEIDSHYEGEEKIFRDGTLAVRYHVDALDPARPRDPLYAEVSDATDGTNVLLKQLNTERGGSKVVHLLRDFREDSEVPAGAYRTFIALEDNDRTAEAAFRIFGIPDDKVLEAFSRPLAFIDTLQTQ